MDWGEFLKDIANLNKIYNTFLQMRKNQSGFAHLVLVLVIVLVGIGALGYFAYKNGQIKVSSPKTVVPDATSITPTPLIKGFPGDNFQVNNIDSQTSEFINLSDGYSLKFPNEYELKRESLIDWELDLKNLTEYYYGRAGNIIYTTSVSVNRSGANFERILRTENGYDAKQYLYINEPDHPQGLGSVYTVISKDNKNIEIYTFIGGFLEDIQKTKSLNKLNKSDYLEILDFKLKGYEMTVKTFKFL